MRNVWRSIAFVQYFLHTYFSLTVGDEDQLKVQPHIIYILASDLGWNDVSFHGSPEIPTPNIDALAASGIILQNFYTTSRSSSSRGSLLTGLYPQHIGLQDGDIKHGEPSGLPLETKILPEYLKELGYAAHMVGKWHLGYFRKEYTPLYRGFDSFLGCLNGNVDHFDYTSYGKYDDLSMWGVDFYDGMSPLKEFRGEFLNEVLTDRALEIIGNHNLTQPLFLFVSSTSPQAGNIYAPLQARPQDVRNFRHILDINRRTYAGSVSSLDKTVGAIFLALSQRNMTNNTIIVFSSSNGAPSEGYEGGQGSNWPLRGQKNNLFEGGVRVPAFVWSPLLNANEPRVAYQLMHVTDWLPSLYYAAGGDIKDLGEINGKNLWTALTENTPSPRTEVLFNLDSLGLAAALRIGDYKLIQGSFHSETNWLGATAEYSLNSSLDEWVWKNGSVAKSVLEEYGWWRAQEPDEWRIGLTTTCDTATDISKTECDPVAAACLFNIVRDPCEQQNLAKRYPKIVQVMKTRLRRYQSTAVKSVSRPVDPKADPRCHGFSFVPWADEEQQSECPYNGADAESVEGSAGDKSDDSTTR